jgi:hypothetical protein
MRKILLFAATLALASTGTAEAKTVPPTGTPATIQRLMACRALTDSAQRLQCYDRETAAVDQAMTRKELVMIDKARASAAKRSLFGFSVPDFAGLFGGDDDQVKEITSTVTGFGHNVDGGWIIRLADGSTWSQTDDAMLGLPPERGNKVVVHRGTFGNFFLRLNGQPGFKVKRIG